MKYIGIVIAMDEEHEEILKLMKEIEEKEIYNLRFLTGKIKEKNCVIVKSGVGKVNAARTTQVMIQNFDLEYVINIGVAGAINELLSIGDVVIGKHVVQHDFDITAFDHSKGYITGVGDKVECDRDLVEQYKKVIEASAEKKYAIKIGVVATGDIFLTEVWMKDKIRAKFDADVVDMECGAVAQVCYLDNIPFMAIRCVSDSPNGNNATTFDENLKLGSRRCANILKEVLS